MPHRSLPFLSAALALAVTFAPAAHAVGQRVDVEIVDRVTGETLTPILHDGAWWVAGNPGARYRVRVVNRNGRRTLNVISIDGVNAISGETAAWQQSGYVIDPFDRTEVDGWRKSNAQIAAFTFATLSDSYAARTGRPGNVGVIGIAVFDEKPVARALAGAAARNRRDEPLQPASPAPSSDLSSEARSSSTRTSPPARAVAQSDRLGTGHGDIEDSSIQWVSFVRARSTPDEIVTIHYDRLENLIAMGIVSRPVPPLAGDPFPGSHRFVPDPPPR